MNPEDLLFSGCILFSLCSLVSLGKLAPNALFFDINLVFVVSPPQEQRPPRFQEFAGVEMKLSL